MGQALSLCEQPFAACQLWSEPENDKFVLKVKTKDGRVIQFREAKTYVSHCLNARYNIHRRRRFEKNQGRPRQNSPKRERTNLRGETVYRTQWEDTVGTVWDATGTGYGGSAGSRQDICELYPSHDYRFRPKTTWVCRDGVTNVRYLFALATEIDNRVLENVEEDVQDIETTQSYAHRFNMQFQSGQNQQFMGLESCKISLCRTEVAQIIDTSFTAMMHKGEFGMLTALPHQFAMGDDIEKFLFDSTSPYCEIAQTFFHYVFFMSGGREMVTDMQGILTDEAMILYDPVVLRCGALTGGIGSGSKMDADSMNALFKKLYPTTTRTAKSFDPDKSIYTKKTYCGISCGL